MQLLWGVWRKSQGQNWWRYRNFSLYSHLRNSTAQACLKAKRAMIVCCRPADLQLINRSVTQTIKLFFCPAGVAVILLFRGAGMAQWWERLPRPSMCPGFDSRTLWVEFVVGSLLCSERFFFGYSGFPLSLKCYYDENRISKFQFDPGMRGHFWTSYCELLGAPWVNKLHLHIYILQWNLVNSATKGPRK